MRAVIALHAPLGLRRTRGHHQPNAQLRAHASELRDRSLAPQPFALPLPTPPPCAQHPPPTRPRGGVPPVPAGQMSGGRRRPEARPPLAAVLPPPPPQHLLAKRPRLGPSARPPHVAMLQPGRPFAAIPPPQPLRLPITHLQQRRRVHQLQLLALHSRQHFHSPQLTAAHRCSPQCGLLPRPLIRGHFNRGEKGTLSSRYNSRGAQNVRVEYPSRATPRAQDYGSKQCGRDGPSCPKT